MWEELDVSLLVRRWRGLKRRNTGRQPSGASSQRGTGTQPNHKEMNFVKHTELGNGVFHRDPRKEQRPANMLTSAL